MMVVDAAAWVRALIDDGPQGKAVRAVMDEDPDWAAPAHMPVEVLRTLRKYELARVLTCDQAQSLAEHVWGAEVRYAQPEPWLLAAVWQFRHNISPYDAGYVALAMDFDAALITFDRRLAKAAQNVGARVLVPGD